MKILPCICIALLFAFGVNSQTTWKTPFETEKVYTTYTECSAIFFDDLMLVDDYSPRGQCKLSAGQKGFIYVATVQFSDNGGGFAKEKIPFQVAIRNNRTNTMRMYSDKVYDQVNFDDVLNTCEEGDEIIILTTDKKYSLSHHVIKLEMGC